MDVIDFQFYVLILLILFDFVPLSTYFVKQIGICRQHNCYFVVYLIFSFCCSIVPRARITRKLTPMNHLHEPRFFEKKQISNSKIEKKGPQLHVFEI